MHRRPLFHLSDGTLRKELVSLVVADQTTTARLIAHLAEFDARRLYAEDGYPSMFAYCVQQLHFSEDMAFKRIRVARAARRHPAILKAIAEGQLHLTGAAFLAAHLTPENSGELIEAAANKTKAEIEVMLAERLPRPDVSTMVRALPTPSRVVPEPVSSALVLSQDQPAAQVVPEPVASPEVVPEPVGPLRSQGRVTPLAPERFAFQTTIGQSTREKLQRIQDLLGHQVASADLAQVLDRAFDALLEKLEKAKFAATERPRRADPPSDPRHIPAQVKRQVWKRDSGRCTFVTESGHRCAARANLENDHVHEVARGGGTSRDNIRLLCRTHNLLAAERSFGAAFMRTKREERARQGPP